MKLSIKKGTTSKTIAVFIPDSSKTDGSGLTGLVYNSAGLVASYWRPGGSRTAITLATLASVTASYSSGGFIEIDATNMKGWYRLDLPDAVLATGADVAGVHLQGATNMAPVPLEIQLDDNKPGEVESLGGSTTALQRLMKDYLGTAHNADRPVHAKFLADMIENQRGHHTYSGNIFYVDGFAGNDTTGDGSRALPYKTISKALTQCVSGNHDIVECVGNPSAIPTVISETAVITVTKAYVFIRGPGRGVQIDLTGAGYVFDIQAVGVEISGFDLVGNGTGNSGGIKVSTADFSYIHDVWISSPTQDGIRLSVSNNTLIERCNLVGAGRDNVRVDSGAGSGQFTRVLDCVIRDAVGAGVNLIGTDASKSQIRRNVIRNNATGVAVGAGVADTVVTDNRFINNTNNITDAGTGTLQAWNFLNTAVDGEVVADLSAADIAKIDAIKAKTDNLPADPASNTQVNTRLATAGYTAPDNAGIAAIQAKTDLLNFVGAAVEATLNGETVDVGSLTASALLSIRGANLLYRQGIGKNPVFTPNTLTLPVGIGANDDCADGAILVLKDLSENLKAVKRIKSYDLATTTVTLDENWTTANPADDDWCEIVALPKVLNEGVEGVVTAVQALRGFISALLGLSSGHTSGASSPKYRDQANSKDRISATTDASGNRTAVTLDLD